MDLKNLSVFDMAGRNMQYLTAKQEVIASNIANASTPGYLAKDVRAPEYTSEFVADMPMKLTNSKHLSSARQRQALEIYTPRPTAALTIDGNGVILEDQMNQASKASSEYRKMIRIYNKYKTMLTTAATKITT